MLEHASFESGALDEKAYKVSIPLGRYIFLIMTFDL